MQELVLEDADVVATEPYVHEKQEDEVTQLAVREETSVSPLDLPPEVFRQGLERRGSNRQALIDWVRKAMVAGTDFGSVPTKRGPSKPSLWKPGAEKICGKLDVLVRFPTLGEYEKAALAGLPIETIILRCELVYAGNVVAEGVGARSVSREYGDINKALKMAEKSAHIDATLRLAGLSEVFTQDLEDMNLDLTEPLEQSIEAVRAKKAAEAEANLSPGVREVLEMARENREREQAKLDARPTDREKLAAAGLIDTDPEAPNVCEGCGTKLVKGGPVKKPGSKYLGRYYMACPSKHKDISVRHTWRAL